MSRQQAFDGRQNEMGRDWPKRRARWLRRHKVCQHVDADGTHCTIAATDVDHVVPRFEGGPDDDTNLQSLCGWHHDQKTATEGHRAWAAHKKKYSDAFSFTETHPGLL